MEQETYDAIKREWGKRAPREQRSLIYRYIQGDKSGIRGSWMEYLRQQFNVPPSLSAPHNPRR